MNFNLIISVLLGPLFALIVYLYVRYRYKNGKFSLYYQAFFGGILSVLIPAIIYFILYQKGYTSLSSLRQNRSY